MPNDEHSFSAPAKLLIRFILHVLLVWGMALYLPEYISITGGWLGYIIIGALLTLLNIIIRPVLSILAFPFKLFAQLLTLIAVNGLFLWFIVLITSLMDDRLVSFAVSDVMGWMVIALLFGLTNWLIKLALHK